MNLYEIHDFSNRPGISDIYTLATDRGIQNGMSATTERVEGGFLSVHGDHTLTAATEEIAGVVMRTDTLKNTGDAPLSVYRYAARFAFPGDAFEVYTQKSHAQHESLGGWQPLITEVAATAGGMWSSTDAAPSLAVYDRIGRRGVVFHLLPCHAWQMTASLRASGTEVYTVVELALYDPAPRITLAPGEELTLSPCLYYEFTDKESCKSKNCYENTLISTVCAETA